MKKLLHGVEIEVDQHPYIPDGIYLWAEANDACLRWRSLDALSVELLAIEASGTKYLVSPKEFARLWPEAADTIKATGSMLTIYAATWQEDLWIDKRKCECGSDKAKLPTHSTWCPKYV